MLYWLSMPIENQPDFIPQGKTKILPNTQDNNPVPIVRKSFFKPYLDEDTFYGRAISMFEPKVSGGALSGVKALLNAVRNGFGATVGIASAIFRLSVQDWAIGLLSQAATIIQGFLASIGKQNTPEGSKATTLNGIVNALTGLIKGFYTEKIEIIKADKQLGKDMNDIGKPA